MLTFMQINQEQKKQNQPHLWEQREKFKDQGLLPGAQTPPPPGSAAVAAPRCWGDPAALLIEMKASEPVLHCRETEAMLTLWTQRRFLTTAEAGCSEMACDSAFPLLPSHRQGEKKKKRQRIQAPLSD